jgi:hypothetical protein
MWAYDANDLLAVKAGTKQPWDVQPYAISTLDFAFGGSGVAFNGATFDPATNRLFVIEANSEDPIVHVLKIK